VCGRGVEQLRGIVLLLLGCYGYFRKLIIGMEMECMMDRMSHFSIFKGIVQSVGLRVKRNGYDGEATFLIPASLPKKWSPLVKDLEVRHDDEKIEQGVVGIWIYLAASYYDREAFFTHSVVLQTSLNKDHGYEYDGDFDATNSVALFKEVSLHELQKELREVLALMRHHGI